MTQPDSLFFYYTYSHLHTSEGQKWLAVHTRKHRIPGWLREGRTQGLTHLSLARAGRWAVSFLGGPDKYTSIFVGWEALAIRAVAA